MYDMYPEWGPAKNRGAVEDPSRPERPRSQDAVQTSLDLRDNGAQRPDDN